MFYVYSKTQVSAYGLVNDPERSEQDFIRGRPEGVDPGATSLSVQGLPLLRPPWGRITAIDLTRGELAWQVAHGETPDSVRNHPALADLEIPRTGRPGVIGTLVTRTLVIAGEAGTFTLPSGEEGAMLRAYAKDTGEELGAVYMPGGQTGSPMTYMLDGNQFIVVAVGRREGAELLAYRLP
jgi:quinoprotein glucose dehydrogenase